MAVSNRECTPTSRLFWQCRRGMLELDILLQDFLDHGYGALDEKERSSFEELLTCHDNLLLEYLMGRTVPSDPVLASLVTKVRHSS